MNGNAAIAMAVLCVVLGCERERPRTINNDETRVSRPKMEAPEPYILNLSFTDHAGKQRTCFEEIGRYDNEPASVHQVKGIRPDGKEEYYYSIKCPKKGETGFLEIHDISGAVVRVDFTSVEVRLVPCQHLPLDPNSKARKEYMDRWKSSHTINDGW